MFDPYHKWLGIPKEQRPPTYYQLLGIVAEEEDREVIEEAAMRQTAHLRNYQAGANARECARLLTEVAQARLTLLNPAKRQAYDAKLAASTIKKSSDQTGIKTALQASATAPQALEVNAFAELGEPSTPPSPTGSRTRLDAIQKPRKPLPWVIIASGGIGVLAILVIGLLFLGGSKPKDQVGGQPTGRQAGVVPTPSKPEPKPVFLSDLQEIKAAVGYDIFGRGGFGPMLTRDNDNISVVSVKGKAWTHSLVMVPPGNARSFVLYRLGKKHKSLAGAAAIARNPRMVPTASLLTFRVHGDGAELWKSRATRDADVPQEFQLNIASVETLELSVECAGAYDWAWAVWLDPQLK